MISSFLLSFAWAKSRRIGESFIKKENNCFLSFPCLENKFLFIGPFTVGFFRRNSPRHRGCSVPNEAVAPRDEGWNRVGRLVQNGSARWSVPDRWGKVVFIENQTNHLYLSTFLCSYFQHSLPLPSYPMTSTTVDVDQLLENTGS